MNENLCGKCSQKPQNVLGVFFVWKLAKILIQKLNNKINIKKTKAHQQLRVCVISIYSTHTHTHTHI